MPYHMPHDIPGESESRLHARCSILRVLLTKSEEGLVHPYCSLEMNPQTVGPTCMGKCGIPRPPSAVV